MICLRLVFVGGYVTYFIIIITIIHRVCVVTYKRTVAHDNVNVFSRS